MRWLCGVRCLRLKFIRAELQDALYEVVHAIQFTLCKEYQHLYSYTTLISCSYEPVQSWLSLQYRFGSSFIVSSCLSKQQSLARNFVMDAAQNDLRQVDVREIFYSPEQPAAVPVWIRKSDMAMAESVLLIMNSGKESDPE